MKTIIKYALVLAAAVPVIAGCTQELMEDKDSIDARYTKPIDQSVTVSLGKLTVSEYVNITIPVTISDTAAVFDFGAMYSASSDFSDATILGATTVDKDGKKLFTSEINVTNLEEETTYYVKAYAYLAGGYIYSDAASIKTQDAPEPDTWTNLGKALYRDGFVSGWYNIEALEYEVDILENDQHKGYYRLVNPYGEAYGYNDPGDWDDTKDYYLEIHAENPEEVYIPYQDLGLAWGYGMFSIWSFADYNGSAFGTLKDGVITFPENSLLVSMADYNDGALYYANNNGAFRLELPTSSEVKAFRGASKAKVSHKVSNTAKKASKKHTVNVNWKGRYVGSRLERITPKMMR